jgi:uncharacterized protein YbjT (DUF2867 family)
MGVFVTGASGSIGSVVVPELIAAGHEVIGLVRSDAAATALAAAGGTPLRGDLTDLDSLRDGTAQADGVINLAFSNDWNNLEQGIDEEARAVQTLAAALAGSGNDRQPTRLPMAERDVRLEEPRSHWPARPADTSSGTPGPPANTPVRAHAQHVP